MVKLKQACTYIFLVFLSACEKDIDLDLNSQPAKIVVDASIENNGPPLVVLSTSLKYFSTITQDELAASFVHDAIITVDDGSKIVQLKENYYEDSNSYRFYFYTIDFSDITHVLLGKFNTTYNLNIHLKDSSVYTSSTTIPLLRKTCDSLWWKPAPENPDTTRCVLYGLFNDPAGLGDYVRYFTSVNGAPFFPGYTSAFDDKVTDGSTYTFQIPRGYNKNDTTSVTSDDYGFFHRGDTITFKFSNIDKPSYDFWRTWEFAYQSNGNPFSSPIKVIGNISNDALGAFCGYATQYRSIIIPK